MICTNVDEWSCIYIELNMSSLCDQAAHFNLTLGLGDVTKPNRLYNLFSITDVNNRKKFVDV
jgi:hypothetical protein